MHYLRANRNVEKWRLVLFAQLSGGGNLADAAMKANAVPIRDRPRHIPCNLVRTTTALWQEGDSSKALAWPGQHGRR